MKIIGITGGIGSGKTTVVKMFEKYGFEIFVADDEAKKISSEPEVISEIVTVFGNEILENGTINRQKLASIVFNDKTKLDQLNNIIHPRVKQKLDELIKKSDESKFLIYESAILIESNFYKKCDIIIGVTAPLSIRIERVMNRNGISKEEVLERIANQLNEEERMKYCKFIIENIDLQSTEKQVVTIIKEIEK